MIINFVGDAVTAVWGAPLPQPDHACKAALAAWHLHKSARIEVDGHALRTRVGFHTGKVLVGNVGSAERFDYAVVGDAVNFASRLEGLNKFLGTNVLLSSSVLEKLGDTFSVRYLGEFRVVGKKVPCKIYELLGPAAEIPRPDWCDLFERGIEAFAAGDLTTAGTQMRETKAMRGGSDGPADFYLGQIDALLKSGLPQDWDGTVQCDKK